MLRSHTAVGRQAFVRAEGLPNVKGHRQRVRAEATRACGEIRGCAFTGDSEALALKQKAPWCNAYLGKMIQAWQK